MLPKKSTIKLKKQKWPLTISKVALNVLKMEPQSLRKLLRDDEILGPYNTLPKGDYRGKSTILLDEESTVKIHNFLRYRQWVIFSEPDMTIKEIKGIIADIDTGDPSFLSKIKKCIEESLDELEYEISRLSPKRVKPGEDRTPLNRKTAQ